jgi:hypothetical protein
MVRWSLIAEGGTMNLRVDMIWEDTGFAFSSSCAACAFRSDLLDDEDAARRAWFDHACVGVTSPTSA